MRARAASARARAPRAPKKSTSPPTILNAQKYFLRYCYDFNN
jgi:hypothetical protein